MRVVNIASGSRGNCTLIETKTTKILLDVGLSIKELIKRLGEVNVNPQQIDAVVITHEHMDHIKGLGSFTKRFKKPVFAHADVWGVLEKNIGDVKDACENQFTSLPFTIGNIKVTPFCVSHDSINCQGFTFECGKAKFAYATDLGYVSGSVYSNLVGAKLVFIESNHDLEMLKNNPLYPAYLKARIRGNSGHLSNNQCADAIVGLIKNGTRYFALSHLSEKNNTPQLAFQTIATAIINCGYTLEKDVFIRLTYQDKVGNNFNLKED